MSMLVRVRCRPILYQASAARLGIYWGFTGYDRRTDRSVRLVCPTGRSDDRIV